MSAINVAKNKQIFRSVEDYYLVLG